MTWTYDAGGRITLRPMTDSLEDAYLVTGWSNLNPARRRQYNQGIFTPDTHIAQIRGRAAHDFLWMIHVKGLDRDIGMTGLAISPHNYSAEYGRLFIDPAFRREWYGLEQMYMVLALAFDFFGLARLWADTLEANKPAVQLYQRAGWLFGNTFAGVPSDRGPVRRLEYLAGEWPEHKARAIERFGFRW